MKASQPGSAGAVGGHGDGHVRGHGHGAAADQLAVQFDEAGVAGLVILGGDTDIADMGKGEGHDLARIGRVRHDLLVPRHRGVEDHLAIAARLCAEGLTPIHGAIGQGQRGLRRRGPADDEI